MPPKGNTTWADVAKAQERLASTLLQMSKRVSGSTRCEAHRGFRERGGLESLVALLRTGQGGAAASAASAIGILSAEADAYDDAIREAGGIPALVALLAAGAESEAAESAAAALHNLSCNEGALLESRSSMQAAILDALPAPMPAILQNVKWVQLCNELRVLASRRLEAAEVNTDVAALEHAIERAQAVSVEEATLQRAAARLTELQREAATQARREALGLQSMATPDEFICPITFDKMRDPVVASDGNSYERAAIEELLRRARPLSPLTREPLTPTVFANRNLRNRIVAYDAEVLDIAAQAVTTALSEQQQQPAGSKRRAQSEASGSGSTPADERVSAMEAGGSTDGEEGDRARRAKRRRS